MTIHKRNRMRHSSTWPDRAPQTVKMRVDPLSRAFTIIPTSRETVYRLEPTAPRSNCLEEVILLDRCAPGGIASVTIKRRLADGRPFINKKAANLDENSTGAKNNETGSLAKSYKRYFMPRSLSSTETIAFRRDTDDVAFVGNTFRNQLRCKSDILVKSDEARKLQCMRRATIRRTISDTEALKLYAKDIQREFADPSTSITYKSPVIVEANVVFDVTANVANEIPTSPDIVQTNNWQRRETDGARKKCQTGVSPASSPRYVAAASSSSSSPPHIKVVDYDDYLTSVSSSSKRDHHHACSKCTSEGVLRSQIDPFRSPSQNNKNDNNATTLNVARRRDDSGSTSFRRKKETRVSERQSKDTWHAERLIEEAKNEDGDGIKPERRRNGGSSPMRLADHRKEATLRRHYYPEGGWGYVIVTCSMLVHFLGVGLQLAAPGVWHIVAENKFRQPPLHSTAWKINLDENGILILTQICLLMDAILITFYATIHIFNRSRIWSRHKLCARDIRRDDGHRTN